MIRQVGIVALALALADCATVTRGSRTGFTVTSEPTGAEIQLSNGLTCTTPCALRVKRRPGFTVTAEKEGYKTVTTSVVSQVSGGGGAALAGNVILGGIVGGAVDAGTGAMNELNPNPLHIVFEED